MSLIVCAACGQDFGWSDAQLVATTGAPTAMASTQRVRETLGAGTEHEKVRPGHQRIGIGDEARQHDAIGDPDSAAFAGAMARRRPRRRCTSLPLTFGFAKARMNIAKFSAQSGARQRGRRAHRRQPQAARSAKCIDCCNVDGIWNGHDQRLAGTPNWSRKAWATPSETAMTRAANG